MDVDPCPYCNRANEVHSNPGGSDKEPEPGDVSLCWSCKEPSIFADDCSLRKATDEERATILKEPDVMRALYVMHEALHPSEAFVMYQAMEHQIADLGDTTD